MTTCPTKPWRRGKQPPTHRLCIGGGNQTSYLRKDAVLFATSKLTATSPTPRLDAEILVAYLCNITRLQLITSGEVTLSPEQSNQFVQLLDRRGQGEPIAYITGTREFWGLPFYVTPAVLVPRPETELIVEQALLHLQDIPDPHILDLGTGSGCIAISLAHSLLKKGKTLAVTALDVSEEALQVARKNAVQLGVEKQIQFLRSNWFSALTNQERFHLIVANPPYIAVNDQRVSPETKFEPSTALYAEDGGLSDIVHILGQAHKFLHAKGMLLMEIGFEQGEQVRQLAESYGRAGVLTDLAGRDRVLVMEI